MKINNDKFKFKNCKLQFLGEQLRLTVEVDDYLDKLVEYCMMKLYAIASVEETNQTWAEEDDFQVIKPNINVKVIIILISKLKIFLFYF